MIVLLIVAVVLAATAPMITRKISRERSDKIFDVLNSDPANAVEYVKGRNQRIFMDGRPNGYVGIQESGKTIPINSVLFGRNSYTPEANHLVGIGFNTTNKGKNTIVIGYSTSANGDSSIAIGDNTSAHPAGSTAIGSNAKVINVKTHIGNHILQSTNSTAIGYNATVAGAKNATAIGYNAIANNSNTIVLGTEDDTVYIPGNLVVNHSAIIGLADGYEDNLYLKPIHLGSGQRGPIVVPVVNSFCNEVRAVKNGFNYESISLGPYTLQAPNNYSKHETIFCMQYRKSDIRLKNVGESFTGGLEELNKLNFYNFTFKDDKDKTPQVGVMAQDLQKVFPNAVKKDQDGWLQIRWDEMFYSAINAIKELNNKVIAISDKLQEFAAELTDLKAKVDKQQTEIKTQAKTLNEQQQELEKLSEKIKKLEHKK